MAVTTHYSPKPFTWSYSRLKNYEACPKKHLEVDIKKRFKEEESEQLAWGNSVHKALADYIQKGGPLPKGMEPYKRWCDMIVNGAGTNYVEQKLAITKDFTSCGYFDKDVWFRAVGDVIKINGSVGMIIDWKTGKILEDSVQLALAAACVFAEYPEVQVIRSMFVWLKEDADTREDFTRADMPGLWRVLWPRIEAMKVSHETSDYPAKQGGLCKRFCPVKSCAFNGG